MTDTRTAQETALLDRLAPKLVNLQAMGNGQITITFLLGGSYYTVERIRPDFEHIADDVAIKLPPGSRAQAEQALRDQLERLATRAEDRGYPNQADHCESFLLETLLANGSVTFKVTFEMWLAHTNRLDLEPTNRSYYEALKLFTTVWLSTSEIVQKQS